jgi:hypothetical protein
VRSARRAIVGLALLAAAVAVCRAAGAALPATAAITASFALALGLPGLALLRASGLDRRLGVVGSIAVVPVAGLAAWTVPLLAGMLIGLPFSWVAWFTLCAGALCLALLFEPLAMAVDRTALALSAIVAATTVLASRWQPPSLAGDGYFHAGRVRKLLDLPDLSFSGVSAYQDGHVHAGYAFPLLHGVEAAAMLLSGSDASAGFVHLVPGCAALLGVAVFAAGRALGGSTVGYLAAWFVLWDAFARSGGVIDSIEQPSTFVFLLLFPAAVYLIIELVSAPVDRLLTAAVCAAVLTVSLVHPTYALALLAIVAGAVACSRQAWRCLVVASVLTAAVFGAIWFAALRGGTPGPQRPIRAHNYWIVDGHPVALAGDWIIHSRVEALASILLVVPLLVSGRRRWAIAASLEAAALALVALPGVTTLVVATIGNGQPRRLWAGIPWEYLPALALVYVASRMRGARLMAAAAGIAAVSILLGWQGLATAWLTIVTSGSAVVATAVVAIRFARRGSLGGDHDHRAAPAYALLLMLALMAGGFLQDGRHTASVAVHGLRGPTLSHRLTPGLISWMRQHDQAPFPVVMAPLRSGRDDLFTGLAFELIGEADVYAVGLPSSRTRAEARNDPERRRSDVVAFFDPATSEAARLAILDRYNVSYVVVDLKRTGRMATAISRSPFLEPVYRDRAVTARFGQFEVWRVIR